MSVKSATSSVPKVTLPAALGEGNPSYRINALHLIPPDKQVVEIGQEIIRADEEIGKISKHPWMKESDPDHARGIKEIWSIAREMIHQGYDYASIESRINNEIAAHRIKMETRYQEQRVEDTRKIACFGQRLRCMDFPQRVAEISEDSHEATGVAIGGSIIRHLVDRAAHHEAATEMEHARLKTSQSSQIASNGIRRGATNTAVQKTEKAAVEIGSSIRKARRAVESASRTRVLLESVARPLRAVASAMGPVARAAAPAMGPAGVAAAGISLYAISNPSDPEEGKRARFGAPLSHSDFRHELRHGVRDPYREPSLPLYAQERTVETVALSPGVSVVPAYRSILNSPTVH